MFKNFILFIALLTFSMLTCRAQWPHSYHLPVPWMPSSLIEAYDKGYVIAGVTINYESNDSYGYLIKTDVNGNELWHKYIADSTRSIQIQHMIQTSDGGIALSGIIYRGDLGIFIKLNPCFELEWSRAMSIPTGTFKTDIHELGDNNFLTMVTTYSYELAEAKTLFYNLKNNGDLNWSDTLPRNSYCMPDPFGREFILTADSNYLVTCNNSNRVSLIKTDKQLNKIWDLCHNLPNGAYIGSTRQAAGGNYFSPAGTLSYCGIFEFSDSGMPIREIDSLASPPPLDGAYTPGTTCVFNDTVVVCGFSYISQQTLYFNNFLIVIDTSGKKLSEIPLIISADPPVGIERSYDDKLLVLYHSQTQFDNILNKFQPVVPYINNTYFVTCATNTNPIDYDFLCGHPISSDTITIHPGVITGIIGFPPTSRQIPDIEIWPNPGSQIIRVILSTKAQQGDQMFIINETGKFMKSVSLLNNSKEMNLDISSLPNGIYFAMHERKGMMLEKGKLIVER